MVSKNNIFKISAITMGSISLSMAITYSLCMIWGENHLISTNYTLLISFIAPLIITPIVCIVFINLNEKLKETERLLKDENHWRRLLVEESGDAIVVVDQNAKVFMANTRFADMLGYSKEEVQQLHVWDWDIHFNRKQVLELADVDNSGLHFVAKHRRKDGRIIDVELSNNGTAYRGQKLILCICRDITDRKKAEEEREDLINRLQDSLAEIKTLRGILPICSSCKKIRDDDGYWQLIESYIGKHSDAQFSHGLCPDCVKKLYPDMNLIDEDA